MATIILIVSSLVMLTGSWMVWRAVRRAPEGFEDETGFHAGREPRAAAVGSPAVPTSGRREPAAIAGGRHLPDLRRPSHHVPSV